MTPAETLIAKLHESDGVKTAPVAASAHQALSQFSAHIKWLVSRHAKKLYKDEYLVSHCFRRGRVFLKTSEFNAYCRANLIVCDRCFDELLGELQRTDGEIAQSEFDRYNNIIRDYVFDIRLIAEYLERKKDPNYIMFHGWKANVVHSWKLFEVSRQLAVQSSFHDNQEIINHTGSQIASVFVLRQALEAKFERIIAVRIYNKNGDRPRLRHSFHHDFIKSHPDYFKFNSFEFDNVAKIYQWCNDIVHNSSVPLVWQISYAHLLCRHLFRPVRTRPDENWSIDGAVEITNLREMQSDFIGHFTLSYMHGIWAVDPDEPEAVVLDHRATGPRSQMGR